MPGENIIVDELALFLLHILSHLVKPPAEFLGELVKSDEFPTIGLTKTINVVLCNISVQ